MLFLYLAIIITGSCFILKVLLPEIRKPAINGSPSISKTNDTDQSNKPENRIAKLEMLLDEKTKSIQLLQTDLKIFHVQVRNFDKIRSLLEEEIHRLREQNRIFRSELGLPTVAQKENSLT